MDTSRHAGRVAIVTGAASGIGQATAVRLAREGAFVVGCDVDGDGLANTLKLIEDGGYPATMLAADVSQPATVQWVLDELPGGRVDMLANVAGVMDRYLPLSDLDDETWDQVIAVNLTGVMRMSRAVLPAMRAAGHGVIVNVASIGGLTGSVAGTAYVASKHGVIGLTRSIAYLYAPDGIRCSAVCPGSVQTNIGRTPAPEARWAFERMENSFARAVRTAQPEEIAALISWLGSAEASNVNGAVITSDAGWTA